ncbi:MAG: MFS transporter [archaeon]|nr:MFS transporter [archaeon]
MGYSILAPLFPTLIKDGQMSESSIGWMLSFYSLCNFLITIFCPYLFQKYGRIKSLYFCTIAEASMTAFYGLFKYFHNYNFLIFVAIICRIIHGTGSGITATLCYSLPAQILTDDAEKQYALAVIEMAWSLGVSIGPVFGSIFYAIGGYSLPFYFLGFVFFISIYCIKYLKLPSESELEKESNKETPSLISLIFNLRLFLPMMSVVVYIYGNTFYFPSLTYHLTERFNLSTSIVSLFFGINMLAYFIILQYLNIITDRLGSFGTMLLGFIFIVIGAICIFPISILPQSIIFVIIGLILVGAAGGPINVPSIIIMENILKNEFGINEFVANDIASAIYNFGVNVGDFSGPVIGGTISDHWGFEKSCIVCSIVNLIFGLIYLFFFLNDIKKELNQIQNKNTKETENINSNIKEDFLGSLETRVNSSDSV